MRKKILLLAVMFLLIPSVLAWDMCEDKVDINTNCSMPTPVVLDCSSFTYDILNLSGSIVSSGNLGNVSGDIYYLNITEAEGDYIVRLCDGTTREIRVSSEDSSKMILGIIILLPMLLGFFMLIGAATLGEDHNVLRIVLFLLSVPSFWMSMHFGMISLVNFYNLTELQESMGNVTFWTAVIFFVLVSYFIMYGIYKMVEKAAQKKKARLEY